LTTDTSGRWKGTVLLVDGDPQVIRVIRPNLRCAGLMVVSAKNAAEVLAKASKVRPDIILLDAVLPDMNGLDICRRLKANHDTKQIPVVLMNSRVEYREIAKGIAARADDYVSKPLDPSELVAVLKANLRHLCLDIAGKPSINLPESTFIYNRIRALIEEGRYFAVMYLDIGYPSGFGTDQRPIHSKLAIRLLTEIVSEVLQIFGNAEDLMGHFEEDSLAVVTTPQRAETLCRIIISQFDDRILDLFGSAEANLDQGYILGHSQPESNGEMPLTSVSIAVVANDMLKIRTPLEVEKLGAELRSYAKCKRGSNYCFVQRHDNSIMALDSETSKCSFQSRRDTATLRDALSRISSMTRSLGDAMTLIRSSIDSSLSDQVNNQGTQQQRNLGLILKRAEQLLGILDDLNHSADIGLASIDPFTEGSSLDNNIDLDSGC
jgi:DNA-binding response OmpR family regulator